MCGLNVNPACYIDKFDMTLMHTFIQNCYKLNPADDMWWNTIQEVRNKLAHDERVRVFVQDRLQNWWDKVKGSILGLASNILPIPEYMEAVQIQIKMLEMASCDVKQANKIVDPVKAENSKVCVLN